MSERPVEAYAQSQSSRDPKQKERDEQPCPREVEKGRQRADVKDYQYGSNYPIQPVLPRLIVSPAVKRQRNRRGHALFVDRRSLLGSKLVKIFAHPIVSFNVAIF
jgi:hypothetical protein